MCWFCRSMWTIVVVISEHHIPIKSLILLQQDVAVWPTWFLIHLPSLQRGQQCSLGVTHVGVAFLRDHPPPDLSIVAQMRVEVPQHNKEGPVTGKTQCPLYKSVAPGSRQCVVTSPTTTHCTSCICSCSFPNRQMTFTVRLPLPTKQKETYRVELYQGKISANTTQLSILNALKMLRCSKEAALQTQRERQKPLPFDTRPDLTCRLCKVTLFPSFQRSAVGTTLPI